MSSIKLNQDLFLGAAELERLVRFLRDDAFLKHLEGDTEAFGIINRERDTSFDNLKIIAGSSPDRVTLKAGFAIDKNFDVIIAIADQIDTLIIPTDSTDRFIFVKYKSINEEVGTVDIAANGDLAGTGTFFTEVLRGLPNFPSRIRFPNSILNTSDYDVVQVNNDTDAIISGSLTAETDQEYIIVGTFTPDHPVPTANEDIFVYDSFELRLDLSSAHTVDEEFLLAKVNTDGAALGIEDQRTEFYESKASFEIRDLANTTSLLYGIEAERFDTVFSDRSENLITLAWGWRSEAGGWSVDAPNRKIVITAGNGGIFDDPTAFATGDFDGHRVYISQSIPFASVNLGIVETSTKVGGTIELIMRQLDTITLPTVLHGAVRLQVVPNCAQVQIEVFPLNKPNTKSFHIVENVDGFTQLRLKVGDIYDIRWTPLSGKFKGTEQVLLDGDYLNANSFDDDGVQTSTVLSSVAGNLFTPLTDPDNFRDKKADIDEINLFTAEQNWAQGLGLAINASDALILDGTGNAHLVSVATSSDLKFITDRQKGTVLFLTFTATFTGFHNTGSPPAGTVPVILSSGTTVFATSRSGFGTTPQTFVRLDDGINDGWMWIGAANSVVDAQLAATTSVANSDSIDAIEAVWSIQGFSAGDFTSDAGVWTVSAATLKFKLIGKTMFIVLRVTSSSITGTPAELRVVIPSSKVVNATVGFTTAALINDGGGSNSLGLVRAEASDTLLRIKRTDGAALTNGTTTIELEITIETT